MTQGLVLIYHHKYPLNTVSRTRQNNQRTSKVASPSAEASLPQLRTANVLALYPAANYV